MAHCFSFLSLRSYAATITGGNAGSSRYRTALWSFWPRGGAALQLADLQLLERSKVRDTQWVRVDARSYVDGVTMACWRLRDHACKKAHVVAGAAQKKKKTDIKIFLDCKNVGFPPSGGRFVVRTGCIRYSYHIPSRKLPFVLPMQIGYRWLSSACVFSTSL